MYEPESGLEMTQVPDENVQFCLPFRLLKKAFLFIKKNSITVTIALHEAFL